jgi:uncharacterized protein (TIGR01615 family)
MQGVARAARCHPIELELLLYHTTSHLPPRATTLQAAHLLAELRSKQPAASCSAADAAASSTGTGNGSSSSGGDAATSPSCPSDLLAQLALRLASHGFDVVLRTCCPTLDAGGGAAGAGCTAGGEHKQQHQHHQAAGTEWQATGLRHSFLRVSLPEAGVVQAPVIVDPRFRQQFVMPHPTHRYASVLEALPAVLCLNEARMWLLLERLATETATAFKETRLTLPPWRHPAAVHDKWLGAVWRDAAVDADSSVEALSHRFATASLGPLVH